MADGKVHSVIDRTIPLAESANAHAYIAQGRKREIWWCRCIDP